MPKARDDDPPVRRHPKRERIVVPSRPIKQFAAEAAEDLARTVHRLESWMHRAFPAGSRPYAALAVLRDIATTARFTRAQRGDDSGLRALQLALDLHAIGETLPQDRVTDLRRDLETCALGPLEPPPEALHPLQAQSQLVVRAAFFRAGVPPGQPAYSGKGGRKKPDILIERGASIYGIEVKRPTALKNVVPRAQDAAFQLTSAGLKGGIVLDVTDAVTADSPGAIDDQILQVAQLVMDTVFTDGVGWKPGYSEVWMITVMARPAWQVVMTSESNGEVLIHSTSAGVALGTAAGTLDTIRANWMRDSLADGLNKLGFTSQEP